MLAGMGFSALVTATASRVLRGALTSVLVIASGQLGWQAWRASVTYASDPRNPYVYAQTVPDAVRMATRIRELAALHPAGARMQVSVIAPPHEQWPLPWYLRAMPHVGYWTAPGDPLALQAPVVVASMDHTAVARRCRSAIATSRSSSASGRRCSWRCTSSVGCGSVFSRADGPQAIGGPPWSPPPGPRGRWPGRRRASRPRCRLARRGPPISGVDSGLARDGLRGHRETSREHCERAAAVALWRTPSRTMTPLELALVIPCYNEAARLDPPAFVQFTATHPLARLVLVDDGSDDGTGEILERMHAAAPAAVTVAAAHAASREG